MRVGLYLVPLTAQIESLRAIGERSDRDPRIHSLWIPEPHLLAFPDYSSEFPYTEDGKMPEEYSAEGELDGLLALAYLAAVTERIRIGIGVCVLPQWQPVAVAKEVTTLDHLSGGRFDFGVGIGWLEEEFRAVGASFKDRASRCREDVQVMQALWADDTERLGDSTGPLAGATQVPFPLQRPHPPIYFGGNGRRALERVAELGQGWLPWDMTPEQAEDGIVLLEQLLEAQDRTRADITVSVATPQPIEEIEIRQFVDAGIDELLIVVPTARSEQEVDELFQRLSGPLDEASSAAASKAS